MKYGKSFLTLDEQADRLIGRGLEIDRGELLERLRDTGYFRLSGYWNLYKQDDRTFP